MISQIEPIIVILGAMFLIAGLTYLIILRQQRNKYKVETLATIISCREYEKKAINNTTYKYYALVMGFDADNKNYKMKHNISKSRKPFSIGEQVVIFYNPEESRRNRYGDE